MAVLSLFGAASDVEVHHPFGKSSSYITCICVRHLSVAENTATPSNEKIRKKLSWTISEWFDAQKKTFWVSHCAILGSHIDSLVSGTLAFPAAHRTSLSRRKGPCASSFHVSMVPRDFVQRCFLTILIIIKPHRCQRCQVVIPWPWVGRWVI